MNSKKKAAQAKAKAAKKMVIVQLKKLLNTSFKETDVKVKLEYAPEALLSYASRGTEARDVIVTVKGLENRDVFDAFKETINNINRRRKHHGGEGVRFYTSLVEVRISDPYEKNTAPAVEEQGRQEPRFVPEDSFGKHYELSQKCKCQCDPTSL